MKVYAGAANTKDLKKYHKLRHKINQPRIKTRMSRKINIWKNKIKEVGKRLFTRIDVRKVIYVNQEIVKPSVTKGIITGDKKDKVPFAGINKPVEELDTNKTA